MNYAQPRQIDPTADRPDAGRWRYTVRNDDRVWPTGYCAQDCPGHDTPDEAREHQRAYMLDQRLRLDGTWAEALYHCEALVDGEPCGAWTNRFARVGSYTTYTLCGEHHTQEAVAALYTQGDAIYS